MKRSGRKPLAIFAPQRTRRGHHFVLVFFIVGKICPANLYAWWTEYMSSNTENINLFLYTWWEKLSKRHRSLGVWIFDNAPHHFFFVFFVVGFIFFVVGIIYPAFLYAWWSEYMSSNTENINLFLYTWWEKLSKRKRIYEQQYRKYKSIFIHMVRKAIKKTPLSLRLNY